MCQIINYQEKQNTNRIDFTCETSITSLPIKGEITGKIMPVSAHRVFYTDFLKDLSDTDNILFIDHFYPLGRNPEKDYLGHSYGEKCLNAFLQKVQANKAIVVNSVNKNNKYMITLLKNNGFECLLNNGVMHYGKQFI